MVTRPFDFQSPAGYHLSGKIEIPEAPVRGWALFAHCFTCGKEALAAVRIGRALKRQGIGVLRFDFAGLGGSGGEFADSFAADTRDLVAAGEAMAAAGMAPSLLIGHSLGGAAALAAAGDLPMVKAVATIAAPFDITHVLHQFAPESIEEIRAMGSAEVVLAGRQFVVRRDFIDDLRNHDQGARIAKLGRALLVMHAPRDETVGIENATQIFVAAKHPKSFVSLDDADHLLSRQADADYVADVITSWAVRYMPKGTNKAMKPAEIERQDGCAIAEETHCGRYQLSVQTGGIAFTADEPVSVGGLGSGPTPYELLSGALAACTTMTLRMYAEQKGWPVEHIRVAVGHARETDEAVPDLFTRRVSVAGALDETQRGRLIEIANKCPVHRTLEQGARVETELGEPPAPAEPTEAHARDMGIAAG